MKLFLLAMQSIVVLILISALSLFAQESGSVRYLNHLIPPQGGSFIAGCWGWTDTTSGREYALLGSYCGTSIVEITNVNSLVERDFIPGPCSEWHEIQTYKNYAYVVSEGGSGVQIIDLSYLPDSAHLVQNFVYTSGGKNTVRNHTLHIKDGYMYLNGSANWSVGGIVIFSLANPVAPTYVGEWEGSYIHDCFVRNDTIYGAAIYGEGLKIINATNKANPQLLYTVNYTGSGTHNTATTDDGKYAFTTDEIGSTAKTLKIWDLRNPPTFPKVAEYVGNPDAIVHNVFVKGNLAIMSYYTAGIKIVDISDPENPVELGGYDTYSGGDGIYDGAWSVYPYFPSGKIIIGDMSSALYVVELNLNGPKPPHSLSAFSDYQTPTSVNVTWTDPTQYNNGNPLSNFKLHIYRNGTFIAQVDSGVQFYTDNGLTKHSYYTYSINAVSGSDSSSLATGGAYAGGHATSNPPSSFNVTGSLSGIFLSWINPTRQIDNTTLNDLAYIIFYRDGVAVDSMSQSPSDTGQARSWVDSVSGYHSYYIRARDNETPVHYSSVTSTLSAFGKLSTSLTESFDSNIDIYQHSGTWAVTPEFSANGSGSLTDSPFNLYNNNSSSYVIMSPVLLGDKPVLRFKHAAIVAFADFAFVEVSKDERVTFNTLKVYNINMHSQWLDGTLNQDDWITEQLDLSAYANEVVYIKFRLSTNATNVNDGWYIDDFYLGEAEASTTVSIDAMSSWNLLSVPLNVPDKSVTTLFPSANSSAFAYSGGYVNVDSFELGSGYWLKFDTAQSIQLSGTTALLDTFNVNAKWNLVGSISDVIDVSKVKSIPTGIITSSFYGFNGSYNSVSTIEPGKAYWVKVSQSGKLIFTGFTKTNETDEHLSALNTLNSITIKDNAGHSQILFFGKSSGKDLTIEQYELPPLPPTGAFDARFSNQSSVGLAKSTKESMPISIQSNSLPLTIEWNIQNTETNQWKLKTEQGVLLITNQGSVKTSSSSLSLQFDELLSNSNPTEFSLSQNYPNPFNPSTEFTFQISPQSAGLVTLKIYNTLGEEVATLVNEHLDAGTYTRHWDATGKSSGVYYYRLQSGMFSEEKKLLLVR